MPILPFRGVTPTIAEGCFIAPNATVIGAVTIGAGSSIWFNAVVRADLAPITIGKNSNVQDNCVIHADPQNPVIIGDSVTIGHGAVLHSCTVENGCMIGMKAILLNGTIVGEQSMVGAGAVVNNGRTIPPRSLAVGMPARIMRQVTDSEITAVAEGGRVYMDLSQEYAQVLSEMKEELLPEDPT
jgi:carbonic anhydrase/acetyltransferase-like protein (isoleucine patch superfamily)